MININEAFEDEIYSRYLRDTESVSPEWRRYFQEKYSGSSLPARTTKTEPQTQGKHEKPKSPEPNNAEPLTSIQTRISENMELSLEVPTATSFRTIPVKVLDENRRIINKYLVKLRRNKVSFTHILSWAIVRALHKYPRMNDAFTKIDGKPFRIRNESVNFGLAVDIVKKDGSRMLIVPNIKNAETYLFPEFISRFDNIISKSRNNKLDVEDLTGSTVTLTNPGMIGTTASSPRLLSGQGLILATGSIEYPTEFRAVRAEVLTTLAISKVITITSTYDHRIIQGAESAEFLSYLEKIILGEDFFYDQIFASLKIPFEPVRWAADNTKPKGISLFDSSEMIEKGAHTQLMINAYRVRGHLLASVNPLGLDAYYYPELDPSYYGFTIWDLDRIFHADDNWEKNDLPLRDIIERVRDTYCGSIGIEFMHIQELTKKEWIKKNLETGYFNKQLEKSEKVRIFNKLVESEEFENFLHTKFVGHKRFSLEGSEAFIILIDNIFRSAADNGLKSVVIGMAHRGRLNALVNLIGKSAGKIFNEFEGDADPLLYHGSGDVKYHLGDTGTYTSLAGNSINIMLSPNPSHLELVNPVIEGMARALDNEIGDRTHSQALPVLVHGDSAFAGQGIVAETLNLSQLQGYKTGGTIHIIINNQIGFTTTSREARSTVYASDIAKMIQVPILHVNGFDPEAVIMAAEFAFDYRKKFRSDVIIDMLSYRKYGHNEGDEPTYTQPLLYKKIKSLDTVGKSYRNQLFNEGILTEEQSEQLYRNVQESLYSVFSNRSDYLKDISAEKPVKEIINAEKPDTAFDSEVLKNIADKITKIPDNFSANPKIVSFMKKRAEMPKSDKPAIDWAMAEALAFGTILWEGKDIRFSGQDSRRGTFSQRHAVLVDVNTEDEYIPLCNISDNQGSFRIYDSPLSEVSVLGFEYGYSVIRKDGLVIWEAQFGDFANGAQAMIDQIIVCSESKWNQTTGLSLLLPHGYDGQGPEHSSGRLERFLQLCAEDNLIVCNLSTPAQYFHLLRRQAKSIQKKPLIVMTPKSMLRHTQAVSTLRQLSEGRFYEIIDDDVSEPGKVTRLVLCSGKIYYDLLAGKQENKSENSAIIRIEQLYPLDTQKLEAIIAKYSKAKEIYWVQEEPQNMGAWSYISPILNGITSKNQLLSYIGRKAAASTATGSARKHASEQSEIIENTFRII